MPYDKHIISVCKRHILFDLINQTFSDFFYII
jgi:hypothetical protein